MTSHDWEFVGPRPQLASEADTAAPLQGKESSAYLTRAVRAIREGASIAGILRLGGAGLIVFSLSLFLMQGMEATSDLSRYLLLLGQTILLTGAGFAVGFVLKEPRGARVFFSLALVSIPANFAVLGAMIYSIAPLDNVITQYPLYASWQSTDVNELLIAGVAGLAVLIPMSVFCFAVLSRHSKWWLSTAYLLACTTLLIPLRDSVSVAIISSVCALAIVALLSSRHAKIQRPATTEERFAKALLLVPAALVLARSAMLYDVDLHSVLAIVIGVYYLLRHILVSRPDNSILRHSVQTLAALCAVALSVMLTSLLTDSFSDETRIFLFIAMWLALNIDLTRFVGSARGRGFIHGLWAVTCFAFVAIDSLLVSTSMGFVFNLTIALVLLAASIATRHRLGAILGVVALTGVLIVNGSHLFSAILDTGWFGVAVAGATTIIAGSMFERYWPVVRIRYANRFGIKSMIMNAGEVHEQQPSDTQADHRLLQDVA